MPYNERDIKSKIREIRSTSEPVLDGITEEIEHYEVKKAHFHWLLEQAEKVEVLTSNKNGALSLLDESDERTKLRGNGGGNE